jgi:hypothetical protein
MGLAFRDGRFVTDDPEEQARIKQGQPYGKESFSWRSEFISPVQWLDSLTYRTCRGSQKAR